MIKLRYWTYSTTLDESTKRESYFQNTREAMHYLLNVFPGRYKVEKIKKAPIKTERERKLEDFVRLVLNSTKNRTLIWNAKRLLGENDGRESSKT